MGQDMVASVKACQNVLNDVVLGQGGLKHVMIG